MNILRNPLTTEEAALEFAALTRDLQDCRESLEPEELAQNYRRMLASTEYAPYTGKSIRLAKLSAAFERYLPDEFLAALGYDLANNLWLKKLFSKKGSSNPQTHLILWIFLGIGPEEAFQPWQPDHFGQGPWPCLNHSCSHYGIHIIEDVGIRYSMTKGKKPIGVFVCPICELRYERTGPDVSQNPESWSIRIEAYGPDWENRFIELWLDDSVSLFAMREIVAVGHKDIQMGDQTLKKQARKMGLPFPKPGTNITLGKNTAPLKSIDPEFERQQKRAKYRQNWLSARKKWPHSNRHELSQKLSTEHNWLKKYDGDWLEQHSPPRKKPNSHIGRKSPKPGHDYHQVDQELADHVRRAAHQIRHSTEHPQQVTMSAIGNLLSKRSLIYKNLHRLPLTRAALDEVTETRKDYALRRIEYAKGLYLKQREHPSQSSFERKAGIRNDYRHEPDIAEAITQALNEIKDTL